MNAFVGITDKDWFTLLSQRSNLEEVNFWQPSGNRVFRALEPGELFLFKLHSPDNFVVGGGIFAHSTILPISLAWEAFGLGNGATSLSQMRRRVAKYRRQDDDRTKDYSVGCILLEQPFFFTKPAWIPVPSDWQPNIVQGRTYDLSRQPGLSLFREVQTALAGASVARESSERYGTPSVYQPRLGQGSFRVVVADAYDRRCAVTNERTLPALDAAHIVPYSEGGHHEVRNGLLLRRDLHALFDKGYVTVTPSMQIEVSRRIKEEWENGRDYYRYQGNQIRVPPLISQKPSTEYLEWHNGHVFKG